MTPDKIALPEIGLLTGTFGSAELEAVAVYVLRFQQVNTPVDQWTPMKLKHFTIFAQDDEYINALFENLIWLKCFFDGFQAFIDLGYVRGWVNGEPESTGHVTKKFIDALRGSHWDRSQKEEDDVE